MHIKNITHVSSLLNHRIRDVRDPKQTMRFSSLSKQENHVLVPMCPTACISCIPQKTLNLRAKLHPSSWQSFLSGFPFGCTPKKKGAFTHNLDLFLIYFVVSTCFERKILPIESVIYYNFLTSYTAQNRLQ